MMPIGRTRMYVSFMGILAGFTAVIHGISEASKGNIPTEGFMLNTIGAFTIIPNYLITGIATIIVAIALAVWVVFFIHRKRGPLVFLMFAILVFLVGGGVAQIFFLPIVLVVSTRINKPSAWWEKVLPRDLRKTLAKLWPLTFTAGSFFLTAGIGIWLILLPPGDSYKEPIIEYICWTLLAIGFILQFLIIVSGYADDIERQKSQIVKKHFSG